MSVEKVVGFVIGGAIALYLLYSILPGVFDIFGVLSEETEPDGPTYFELAPTGAEPIVGATLIVFVALVLWTMYNEFS